MLEALKAVFVRNGAFSKLTLWHKLLTLKRQSSDTLEDYLMKFDEINRELEEIRTKIDESDKICLLLITLSSEYDTVITPSLVAEHGFDPLIP